MLDYRGQLVVDGETKTAEQRLNELGAENKRLAEVVVELRAKVRRLEERLLSPSELQKPEPIMIRLLEPNIAPRQRRPGLEMIEDDQDLANALREAEANGNPDGEASDDATVIANLALEAAVAAAEDELPIG